MKKNEFILLNIYDKRLAYFINSFCETYDIQKPYLVPHITLQGPFSNTKSKLFASTDIVDKLDSYTKNMSLKNSSIHINGVGIFENNQTYILYLKVSPDDKLKTITDKKDYPIAKYGFHPHITIATTKNKQHAISIKKNLESRQISFDCHDVEWNIHHTSGDGSLFNISNTGI